LPAALRRSRAAHPQDTARLAMGFGESDSEDEGQEAPKPEEEVVGTSVWHTPCPSADRAWHGRLWRRIWRAARTLAARRSAPSSGGARRQPRSVLCVGVRVCVSVSRRAKPTRRRVQKEEPSKVSGKMAVAAKLARERQVESEKKGVEKVRAAAVCVCVCVCVW
jgi:hypothetical protein